MIYAIFGMPLFLMWASQMGTFLAHSFQFFYGNICCVLCTRSKRRKAALAKAKRQEQLQAQLLFTDPDKAKMEARKSPMKVPETVVEAEDGAARKMAAARPDPLTLVKGAGGVDSGLQSQMSLDKQPKMDMMDPGVKELLATCAKYNLDQGGGNGADSSAEVLEEIRHAEAMDSLRSQSSSSPSHASAPHSPVRGSAAAAAPPASPSPLPKPNLNEADAKVINSNATPQATRKARLGHPTLVSVDGNGSSVTTSLLKSPPPYSPNASTKKGGSSRDPSPSPSSTARGAKSSESAAAADDASSSVIKVSVQPRMVDTSSGMQERVPMLPVLAFVFGYISLGAIMFSTWEKWSILEGAYFSFITLTTIGFGDFVPGDAVLNADSEQGQAKLIIACIYVLMGLAVVAMSINLVQEEIIGKFRQLAKDMGIIDDDDEDDMM